MPLTLKNLDLDSLKSRKLILKHETCTSGEVTALFDFDMIGISLPLPQNPDDGGAKIAGDL